MLNGYFQTLPSLAFTIAIIGNTMFRMNSATNVITESGMRIIVNIRIAAADM